VRTLLIALTFALACKKESAPPPPNTPEQQVDVIGQPVTFSPPAPASVCTYELKEVLTEAIGEQLFAGHSLALTYELRAEESTPNALRFEAVLGEVKLESESGGNVDQSPVAALAKRKFNLELDERGRLVSLRGDLAPLSLDQLADYLVPGALAIPKTGPLASGRQEHAKATFDLPEYGAQGTESFRASLRPDRWLIEQRRDFGPVREVASELKGGDRTLTVEFAPRDPCFKRAGSAFNDLAATARGERKRSVTRIWTRR
jgi:hypothetical protein